MGVLLLPRLPAVGTRVVLDEIDEDDDDDGPSSSESSPPPRGSCSERDDPSRYCPASTRLCKGHSSSSRALGARFALKVSLKKDCPFSCCSGVSYSSPSGVGIMLERSWDPAALGFFSSGTDGPAFRLDPPDENDDDDGAVAGPRPWPENLAVSCSFFRTMAAFRRLASSSNGNRGPTYASTNVTHVSFDVPNPPNSFLNPSLTRSLRWRSSPEIFNFLQTSAGKRRKKEKNVRNNRRIFGFCYIISTAWQVITKTAGWEYRTGGQNTLTSKKAARCEHKQKPCIL